MPLPEDEPALAPAARVLDPGALTALRLGPKGPLRRLRDFVAGRTACTVDADTSRFDAGWFDPAKTARDGKTALPQFRAILDEHNARLPQIAAIRRVILDGARAELAAQQAGEPPASVGTNILATVDTLYSDAMLGEGVGRSYPAAEWLALLDADRGHAAAFDPWNSWWAGPYANPTGTFYNLHIWDPSVRLSPAGYDQYVQPVTQVEAARQWFGSARRLEEEPGNAAKVDYALNVWSVADGVTGYVHKNLATADAKSLPHAGFLVEANVLLWCALVEPKGGAADGVPVPMLMFIETGFPTPAATGHYVIRGALAFLQWSAGTLVFTAPFQDVARHRGDYRAVLPVRDRASLDCAVKTKALGGYNAKAAAEAVAKARKP